MSFQIYRGHAEVNYRQRELLLPIIRQLDEQYSSSNDFCFLFTEFFCNSIEFDALLMRNNAIIGIEIKDYRAETVIVKQQGDVYLMPQGVFVNDQRTQNPFQQIKSQNYAFQNFITKHREFIFQKRISTPRPAIDICGYLVLNHFEHLDLAEMDRSATAYYRITDIQKAIRHFRQYRGRSFEQSQNGELLIVEAEARRLSEVLDLKRVDFNEFEQNLDATFQFLGDYLDRFEREVAVEQVFRNRFPFYDKLLKKNHLVVGAPGCGKSTLLKYAVHSFLTSGKRHPIPCLMSLLGTEHLVDKIASTLRLSDRTRVEKLLKDGDLWILVDGLDEMPYLQEGLNGLKDFVGLWGKNLFTFGLRKQLLTQYSEFFNALGVREGFTTFEIPSLDDKNIREWIENSTLSGEGLELDDVFEFLKSIPEKTPLMLKMAVEIFQMSMTTKRKGGIKSPAYENPGKFYSSYFSARLRREQARKGASPESGILLETILENMALAAFDQQANALDIRDVFQIIKDVTLSEPSPHLASLKMADILIVDGDDKVSFVHATFSDFFLARYFAKNGVTQKVVTQIEEAHRHQVLLLLSGIVDSETLHVIVFSCQYIDNRIHCMCNAGSISPHTITSTTDEIINWIETNNHSILKIFPYIIQYGPRLCGKKLFDYFESRATENRQWAVDWEIVKALKLSVGEIDESIQVSFQFPEGSSLYRVLHPESEYDDLFTMLRQDGTLIGRKGFDLYQQFVQDDFDGIWMLANDTSVSARIRAEALGRIPPGREDKIGRAIGSLFDNEEEFFCENELIAWAASGFIFGRMVEVEKSDWGKVSSVFWKTPFFPVQIRIAYYISQCNSSKSEVSEYFIRILTEYSSTELISEARIVDLCHRSVCSMFDMSLNSDDSLIFDHTMNDLDGLPCEVLMKLFAIYVLDADSPASAIEYLKDCQQSDWEIVRIICSKLMERV